MPFTMSLILACENSFKGSVGVACPFIAPLVRSVSLTMKGLDPSAVSGVSELLKTSPSLSKLETCGWHDHDNREEEYLRRGKYLLFLLEGMAHNPSGRLRKLVLKTVDLHATDTARVVQALCGMTSLLHLEMDCFDGCALVVFKDSHLILNWKILNTATSAFQSIAITKWNLLLLDGFQPYPVCD